MVLQGRDVVVAQRQLGTRVYLVDVIVARMVEIVADAGDDQYENLEVADFRRQILRPGYRVHLRHDRSDIKSHSFHSIYIAVRLPRTLRSIGK